MSNKILFMKTLKILYLIYLLTKSHYLNFRPSRLIVAVAAIATDVPSPVEKESLIWSDFVVQPNAMILTDLLVDNIL